MGIFDGQVIDVSNFGPSAVYVGVVRYRNKTTGEPFRFVSKPYDKPSKAKARATMFVNHDISQSGIFAVEDKYVLVSAGWAIYSP